MLTDKDLDLQRTGGVRERCADVSVSRAVAAAESVPEVPARAAALGASGGGGGVTVAALYALDGGPYFGLQGLTRGRSRATRASTPARIPWSLTHPARAGVATGSAGRAPRCGASSATMAGALPRPSPPPGAGVGSWSIRRRVTPGRRSGLRHLRRAADGSRLTPSAPTRSGGPAASSKGTTATRRARQHGSTPDPLPGDPAGGLGLRAT